jgi:hypothetical protein
LSYHFLLPPTTELSGDRRRRERGRTSGSPLYAPARRIAPPGRRISANLTEALGRMVFH